MVPAGTVGAQVAIGDVLLGKYRVERLLGRGGMGVVVAARHIDLDELFAIKLMLVGSAADGESIERFLREARAAAKIKSEHVARTQDVGRLPDGTPYMVMEHLAGADLKSVLKARGPLGIEECVTYGVQVAETLAEAHQLGIVHRDVKPANMFLTQRRNGTPCIKVLDFGISKHTGDDSIGLTITATVGGSPLYMSPEQMRSAKHVDGRTDIWSLGVVLYELLTGTTPFHAPLITAVASRVLQDEPAPPSLSRPDVPRALDALILRCLQKRPEARFQTMDELAAALRGVLAAGVPGGPARRVSAPAIEPDLPTLPIGAVQAGGQSTFTGSGTVGLLPAVASTGNDAASSRGLAPISVTQAPRAGTSRGAFWAIGIGVFLGITAGGVLLLRGGGDSGAPAGAAGPEVTASLGDTGAQGAAGTASEPGATGSAPQVTPSSSAGAEAAPGASASAVATGDKPVADKPAADKPAADKPAADKPAADKPASKTAPPPKPTSTGSGRKRRTID